MAPRKIRLSEGAKLPPSLKKRIEERSGVELKPQKKEKGDIELELKAPKIVMEDFEEEEEMETPWGAILLSIFLAGTLIIGMLLFFAFLLNETRDRGVDYITPAGFVTTEVPSGSVPIILEPENVQIVTPETTVSVPSGSVPIILEPENVQIVKPGVSVSTPAPLSKDSSGSVPIILEPENVQIVTPFSSQDSSRSEPIILDPGIQEDGQKAQDSSRSEPIILDPGIQEDGHPRELIPSGNISCSVIGDTVLISYSYQNGNDISLYRDDVLLISLGGGSDSGSYSLSLFPGTHLLTLKNGGDILSSAMINIYQEQQSHGPIILDPDNVVLIE
jgi:hypothetical protein